MPAPTPTINVSRRFKKATPSPLPGYLTTAEISARSGATQEHIALLIRQGKLPAILVGKTYLVKEEDWQTYEDNLSVRGRPRGPHQEKD